MVRKIIKVDVYSTEVEVIITEDIYTASGKLGYGWDEEMKYWQAGCQSLEKKVEENKWAIKYVIFFEPNPTAKTVLHECLHMAIRILCHRGFKITLDNHEPLAYLQEYLFGEVEKIVKSTHLALKK